MGILEDIQEAQSKPTRCPVAKAMEAMSEEDAAAMQSALDDPSIEHVVLTSVLNKNGYKVGPRAVGNHRDSRCSCRRD